MLITYSYLALSALLATPTAADIGDEPAHQQQHQPSVLIKTSYVTEKYTVTESQTHYITTLLMMEEGLGPAQAPAQASTDSPSSTSVIIVTSYVTESVTQTQTETEVVTVTPSPSGTINRYMQCGGSNYNGPTDCAPPYTCSTQNPYYAQCN